MQCSEEGQKRVHVTSFNSLLQTAVTRQIQQFRSAEEKASVHHLQSSRTYVTLSLYTPYKKITIFERNEPELQFIARFLFVFRARAIYRAIELTMADSRSDDFHVNAEITGAFQSSRIYKGVPSVRTFFNIALRASRIVGFSG